MIQSKFIVVDKDEIEHMYSMMHAVYEEIVQQLFKNMSKDEEYTFTSRDNRKYTITVK